MTAIAGSAAIVTGAASGLGLALSRELVRRGCDVAIADCDAEGLARLEAELSHSKARKITAHVVDVADKLQMEEFCKAAVAAHPKLNILINNAGVTLYGTSQDIDLADFEWVMGVNFWPVVLTTRMLLPHLARQDEAHIANIASVFSLIAPPGQTAYAASKFAVRGFSESLRHELGASNKRVRVSVVYPSGIASSIARRARVGKHITDLEGYRRFVERAEKLQQTGPDDAARRIASAIERNKPRIRVGKGSLLIDLIQRVLPASYWNLMAPLAKGTVPTRSD